MKKKHSDCLVRSQSPPPKGGDPTARVSGLAAHDVGNTRDL